MICPCCSGEEYAQCCGPFHDGQLPQTPLQLMRSRYSAYALVKVDYIIETTHPQSPYFEKKRKSWEKAIQTFCQTSTFEKLEILESGEDWVHFRAHLGHTVLEEKSSFEKIGDKWLYLKGEIFPWKK